MVDNAYLFLLFWLIPVVLQIVIPLCLLCGWSAARIPKLLGARSPVEAESEVALAR